MHPCQRIKKFSETEQDHEQISNEEALKRLYLLVVKKEKNEELRGIEYIVLEDCCMFD